MNVVYDKQQGMATVPPLGNLILFLNHDFVPFLSFYIWGDLCSARLYHSIKSCEIVSPFPISFSASSNALASSGVVFV